MSKPKITEDMSPMLKALIEQRYFKGDEDNDYDQVLAERNRLGEEEYQKALKQLTKSGDIMQSKSMEDNGLNDKSQIHPQLKNYDHSLEADRLEHCKIKEGKPIMDDHESMRPVERDGEIVYESALTMDELLKRT